ncbi:MAG: DUF530 domain-containing protein [Thaumarchaeota archaeon]|nr:DUF530 domain-containing protein [Nitrososphaerota archaeon]
MRKQRDAYKNAIDRVREAHRDAISPGKITLECPRCGTRQEITDAPGMRRCLKCGFEFSPNIGKARFR